MLKTVIIPFVDLPEHYKEAAFNATDCLENTFWQKSSILIETYKLEDILDVVAKYMEMARSNSAIDR